MIMDEEQIEKIAKNLAFLIASFAIYGAFRLITDIINIVYNGL